VQINSTPKTSRTTRRGSRRSSISTVARTVRLSDWPSTPSVHEKPEGFLYRRMKIHYVRVR
jgi:hypothetical protein